MVSAAALAPILLLAGALTVLAVLLRGHGRERAFTRRVDRVSPVRSVEPHNPGPAGRPQPWSRLDQRLRLLFTGGMARRWAISTKTPYLVLIGLAAGFAAWLIVRTAFHLPVTLAALAGTGAFLLLPRLQLRRQQRRADRGFAELLPEGIDMVVRMVRAGLPVNAAIRTVGEESDRPLSTVFVTVADLVNIGIALDEALARTSASVGNADFRFFAVTVALQQSTGGNLAATLETLSEIIRKRRAVRLKAKAATAEIRISAMVPGGIPFFVVGALLVVSPAYLAPLISDPRGNIIIGSALLSLLLGALTMRSMIRASIMV